MLTQRSHAHAAENRWSLTALQTTSTATRLQVTLDDFGACARATEAARQGVTAEELAEHGVMYYLADLDSARLTRKAPPLRRS